MKKPMLARIIPNEASGDELSRTQGTKVMVGDQPLRGVTKITLVAGVDDVWRATIECMVQPTDIAALAVVHRPTLWERLKWWAKHGGTTAWPR